MKCRGATRNSIGRTIRRYRSRVISGMRVTRAKSRIRNIRAHRARARKGDGPRCDYGQACGKFLVKK